MVQKEHICKPHLNKFMKNLYFIMAKKKKGDAGAASPIIDRVIFLMKKTGISKAELGRRTGVTRSAIGKMLKEKPKSIDTDKLQKFANAFNIDPIWLQYGEIDHPIGDTLHMTQASSIYKNIANSRETYKILTQIPLLVMREAHTWKDIMHTVRLDKARKTLPIYEKDNPNCFGLLIENDIMAPEFKKDDQVVVDPAKVPTSNNFVVVRLNKTGENILRQYVLDGSKIHLIPLNSLYDKITVTPEEIQICGVVAYKCYQ